jgi:nitroimidazol reductase NimA-like FMN-containing flavoprotein (pyridoxamine 5'-phosphate oxidase superfamily)
MRRKDKQIHEITAVKAIIRENNLLHLGLADNNIPYVVPMNYGFDGENLFLHCAVEGKKLDIIRRNKAEKGTPCFFEIVDSVKLYIVEDSSECTTYFRSVMGNGKIFIIDDPEERYEGLKIILKHTINRELEPLPASTLKKTCILKIIPGELTGKQAPVR